MAGVSGGLLAAAVSLARGLDWPPEWDLSTMRNSFTQRWSADLGGLKQNLSEKKARFEAAQVADDTEITPVIVGEAADPVRAIEPAQDKLLAMITQAESHLQRISKFVEPNNKGQR